MDHPNDEFGFFTLALVLLAAAVASVPIARRLGLSAIVAYLVAGIIIGPHGLGVFRTPGSIRRIATRVTEMRPDFILYSWSGDELGVLRWLKMQATN